MRHNNRIHRLHHLDERHVEMTIAHHRHEGIVRRSMPEHLIDRIDFLGLPDFALPLRGQRAGVGAELC
jgi:hypothetical protein